MLHYNYTQQLSHFLTYHQLDAEPGHPGEADQTTTPNDDDLKSTSNNKSFTIAAILGLNGGSGEGDYSKGGGGDRGGDRGDLNVVNLSVHQHHHHHQMADGGGQRGGGGGAVACPRIQLPGGLRHPATAAGIAVQHYGAACSAAAGRHASSVRGLKHLSPNANPLSSKKACKSKRVRTIFTPEQLERLEAEFERQQYMVGPERLYLAHTLQLTEAQVKVWFQNRRIKWRKHHLEITQQRLAALKQQQQHQLMIEEAHADINHDTNSSGTDT